MLEQARLMHFPFEQDQTYTLGALRTFERDLSAARQSDKGLSEEWRVPSTPETRGWAKIREETYPIKLLADHKGYSDDATFRLKPFGFPAVDAELSTGQDQFVLQITIADPIPPAAARNSPAKPATPYLAAPATADIIIGPNRPSSIDRPQPQSLVGNSLARAVPHTPRADTKTFQAAIGLVSTA